MPLAPPVTMIRLPSSNMSEVPLSEDAAVGVQLVEEGNPGRDLELEHLLAREAVQVHHEGSERVAVRGDEDVLARADFREDVRIPIRDDPGGRVGQALA